MVAWSEFSIMVDLPASIWQKKQTISLFKLKGNFVQMLFLVSKDLVTFLLGWNMAVNFLSKNNCK